MYLFFDSFDLLEFNNEKAFTVIGGQRQNRTADPLFFRYRETVLVYYILPYSFQVFAR